MYIPHKTISVIVNTHYVTPISNKEGDQLTLYVYLCKHPPKRPHTEVNKLTLSCEFSKLAPESLYVCVFDKHILTKLDLETGQWNIKGQRMVTPKHIK